MVGHTRFAAASSSMTFLASAIASFCLLALSQIKRGAVRREHWRAERKGDEGQEKSYAGALPAAPLDKRGNLRFVRLFNVCQAY